MSLYSVRNCRFFYDDGTAGNSRRNGGANDRRPAVDIEAADFEAGSIHALLGPNGSGKTTLLKLFNRLLEPEKGTVFFRGKEVSESREIRRSTVYVHQNPLLLSGTVYDNVAYGLKVRGMSRPEIAERVRESLAVVGLAGFGRRRGTALSGGELQRVAIARAIALQPEVLLLDEPTASVDRNSVGMIEDILLRVKDSYGCTVFISTHNFPFAYRIGDTLTHMEGGSILPPSENILSGRYQSDGVSRGIFISRGVEIHCPVIEGNFKRAVIDYDEIIISREPIASSARNNLSGRICDLDRSETHPGQLDVGICIDGSDGGKLHLCSRITELSSNELGLQRDGRVYLAFKASSVRLY